MPLSCASTAVAIYIPPASISAFGGDVALARCRSYLEHLSPGAATVAHVFDDRDVALTFRPRDVLGPEPVGDTPAADRLQRAEATIRLVLIAEPTALVGLPQGRTVLTRIEAFAQVFVATPELVEAPDRDRLDRLARGEPEAWSPLLGTLVYQRTRQPLVTPPAPLVEAFLTRHHVRAWCEIASDVALRLFPGKNLGPQAVRSFERWLEEAAAATPTSAGRAEDPAGPRQAAIDRGHDALLACAWEEVARHAQTALEDETSSAGPDLAGPARRLAAAAKIGQLDFAGGLTDLAAQVLLESLFGRPHLPARRARFPLDRSPVETSLHRVTWLCTRITSMDHPEWLDALDQLEAALPDEPARALRQARAKSGRKPPPRAKPTTGGKTSKTRPKRTR